MSDNYEVKLDYSKLGFPRPVAEKIFDDVSKNNQRVNSYVAVYNKEFQKEEYIKLTEIMQATVRATLKVVAEVINNGGMSIDVDGRPTKMNLKINIS